MSVEVYHPPVGGTDSPGACAAGPPRPGFGPRDRARFRKRDRPAASVNMCGPLLLRAEAPRVRSPRDGIAVAPRRQAAHPVT